MPKIRILFDILFVVASSLSLGVIQLNSTNEFSLIWLTVYSIFFIWFGYRSLSYAFNANITLKSIKADIATRDSKLDPNISLISPFGFVIVFALLSHQLYLWDNSHYIISIPVSTEGFKNYEWVLYAIDNFIRAVCFDFLETYHFHLSSINSLNNGILTLVFIFKTVLSLFFIKSLINLYQAIIKAETTSKK